MSNLLRDRYEQVGAATERYGAGFAELSGGVIDRRRLSIQEGMGQLGELGRDDFASMRRLVTCYRGVTRSNAVPGHVGRMFVRGLVDPGGGHDADDREQDDERTNSPTTVRIGGDVTVDVCSHGQNGNRNRRPAVARRSPRQAQLGRAVNRQVRRGDPTRGPRLRYGLRKIFVTP